MHTCHAKGRDLRLRIANMIASRRQTAPGFEKSRREAKDKLRAMYTELTADRLPTIKKLAECPDVAQRGTLIALPVSQRLGLVSRLAMR